ncbi:MULTISPECIES: ammonium transporter [unclassified Arthrobacter]|uniref:ammonium transporter n=1 Tax=unclassified Arthrobacter TaxID=235627 RepID=UPI00159EB091|nr:MULTISPECIES: ammonium transporter [unclassified Arthrobacter]MCQ9163163.1 ammonium transporter [Arthrobacter sp. STN4]NVM99652.1 ammonium transporter [Arthrobacter sp. SDTb3-6]
MNTGDTAWVLVSAALVLLMTPGLAFFYGGMTRAKGVLNMMMMSFGAIAVVGVLWILFGYSAAFGNDVGGGLLGNPFAKLGLQGVLDTGKAMPLVGTIPELAFVGFQAVFAIITVALISGAIADRAKFGAWMVFAAIWVTVVYFPVAHWVFDFNTGPGGAKTGGWLGQGLGVIDFAGGTAVHINAGAAALALCLILGKRKGFGKDPGHRPHNMPFVMLGAGLLWFGWFGFNAGSALGANGIAGYAWINTLAAPCAATLGWLLVERLRDGHATSLGAASGAVAGLVAITPACAAVTPVWAMVLGLLAGVVCAMAVGLKFRLGFDDSLDVVGVHLVGGIIGTLFIGLAADPNAPSAGHGLFYGGGLELLGKQAVGAFSVFLYSFVLAFIIGWIINKTMGFRISAAHEAAGIDISVHAESAYDFGSHIAGSFHPLHGNPALQQHAAPARIQSKVDA